MYYKDCCKNKGTEDTPTWYSSIQWKKLLDTEQQPLSHLPVAHGILCQGRDTERYRTNSRDRIQRRDFSPWAVFPYPGSLTLLVGQTLASSLMWPQTEWVHAFWHGFSQWWILESTSLSPSVIKGWAQALLLTIVNCFKHQTIIGFHGVLYEANFFSESRLQRINQIKLYLSKI